MAATPTYPVRALPIDERLILTQYKMYKPQFAPYLAAIQAVMNRFIVPYAFIAMAYTRGTYDDALVDLYTTKASESITQALNPFDVNFTIEWDEVTGGLVLDFTARKGTATAATSHEITGRGPDFGPLYEESKDIAKVRWEAYTQLLEEEHVREILRLAGMGYERFMLDDTPTARHLMAVFKHKLKLAAVDPEQYLERIRGAVEKYEQGYEYGVAKYSSISPWISDGLVAAVKASGIVYQVL
jgi:hypothetical protein